MKGAVAKQPNLIYVREGSIYERREEFLGVAL